jgi:hypothetical protein
MINSRGVEHCWHPIEVPEYFEKYGPMACLREKGHSGPHESVMKNANLMDARDRQEHTINCTWHKDWHACDCGTFDACALVIPGTVIACGEDGNYCSQECMRKANDNKDL